MLSLHILNDHTGPDEAANYNWLVDVNGREIARGRVEGHDREAGWEYLVMRVVWKHIENELAQEASTR